ncbi:uncharacterized protein LOC121050190 isoform X2 [Rosa chinensis]|nr:uncharacterized protein LOC121050190 isoform X2 [Rosa chinensis]
MRDRLAVAGVEMNDQDVKFQILAGLPSEYGHTRQIIREQKAITMEEVRSLLLSAEFEIELKHSSLPLSPLTAVVSHNASSIVNGHLGAYEGLLQTGVSQAPYTPNIVNPCAMCFAAINPTCNSYVVGQQNGHGVMQQSGIGMQQNGGFSQNGNSFQHNGGFTNYIGGFNPANCNHSTYGGAFQYNDDGCSFNQGSTDNNGYFINFVSNTPNG